MGKVLVVYYTRSGHTKLMAEAIAKGVKDVGVECDVKPVTEVQAETLTQYDGIILGSPTYYGLPAAEIKALLDASVKIHGKLTGKVGGAFASCGVMGGGCETTVRAILDALLVHGMVVQGTARGAHYGPVCIGAPDNAAQEECRKLGDRVAALVKKLA